MEKLTAELYQNLQRNLSEIDQQAANNLQKAQQAIEVIHEVLDELRKYMADYTFKDKAEEIRFFKEIEPGFHAELIFYVKLFQIESRKPAGGKPALEGFFNTALKQIHIFFLNNEDYYRYYRTHSTFLDENYFLRGHLTPELAVEEYSCMLDNRICTTQSFKTAKIMAYERLQRYLTESLDGLKGEKPDAVQAKAKFKWTGSKVALIELMYALVYAGTINNGQLEVKEFALFLEKIFGIDLGNFYRTKQEMYTRKNMATFLDLLRKRYQEGMDESDEKYRRS